MKSFVQQSFPMSFGYCQVSPTLSVYQKSDLVCFETEADQQDPADFIHLTNTYCTPITLQIMCGRKGSPRGSKWNCQHNWNMGVTPTKSAFLVQRSLINKEFALKNISKTWKFCVGTLYSATLPTYCFYTELVNVKGSLEIFKEKFLLKTILRGNRRVTQR